MFQSFFPTSISKLTHFFPAFCTWKFWLKTSKAEDIRGGSGQAFLARGNVNSPNPSADFFEAIQTNLWRPCGLQAFSSLPGRYDVFLFFVRKTRLKKQWRPQVFQAVRIFRFESTLPDLPEFQVATCPEIPVVSVVQVKVAKPQGSTLDQVQPPNKTVGAVDLVIRIINRTLHNYPGAFLGWDVFVHAIHSSSCNC